MDTRRLCSGAKSPDEKLTTAVSVAVTGSNRDLKFRITGMVTEYKSRNYILLEKAMVESDTGNQF